MNSEARSEAAKIFLHRPKASARNNGQKSASRADQQSSASPDGGDEYAPEHPSEQVNNTAEFDASLELLDPGQAIVHDATFGSGATEDQVMDLMFFQNADPPADQLRSLNYGAVDFSEPGGKNRHLACQPSVASGVCSSTCSTY